MEELQWERGGRRWDRINGVVLGVMGLHLFIYISTVTCVVSKSLDLGVTRCPDPTLLIPHSVCYLLASPSHPLQPTV